MGYEEDGLAGFGQPREQLEKAGGLGLGEDRRGLVEDDHFPSPGEGPDDVRLPALGGAQGRYAGLGIEPETEALDEDRGLDVGLSLREEEAHRPGLAAENDVLGDRQILGQEGDLGYEAYPRRLGIADAAGPDAPAADEYLAGVLGDEAGYHAREGALAGAVLADDGARLALDERERDAIVGEGQRVAEVFRDFRARRGAPSRLKARKSAVREPPI